MRNWLYRFFAPLTVAATTLMMATAGASILLERAGCWATVAGGVLAAVLVGIYFVYFQAANARLAAGKLTSNELEAELGRWAQWHWTRVAIGVGAFVLGLVGLQGLVPMLFA